MAADSYAHLHYADTSYWQALKQLELLAHHLTTPGWDCPRCIAKHGLDAEAFAEEATQLTGAAPRHDRLLLMTREINQRIAQGNTAGIAAWIRKFRAEGQVAGVSVYPNRCDTASLSSPSDFRHSSAASCWATMPLIKRARIGRPPLIVRSGAVGARRMDAGVSDFGRQRRAGDLPFAWAIRPRVGIGERGNHDAEHGHVLGSHLNPLALHSSCLSRARPLR